MVDILTDDELASLLEEKVTERLTLIVEKTNALITENWTAPPAEGEPVPTRVWALAVNIATRAMSNPKRLTSWTRSWDDVTRTERMEGDALKNLGLFITEDEIAELNGDIDDETPSGVGTIHTRTRDQVCPPAWSQPC